VVPAQRDARAWSTIARWGVKVGPSWPEGLESAFRLEQQGRALAPNMKGGEGGEWMSELTAISKLPEVLSAVVGDRRGTVLEAAGDIDGEATAAVMSFTASTVVEMGEALGLGTLQRISIQGEATASVALLTGDRIITAFLDPRKPIASFEKKLDSLHQGDRITGGGLSARSDGLGGHRS